MSEKDQAEIIDVILTWMKKIDCPVELDIETMREISILCYNERYSKNRDKFRKEIEKIVSEASRNHLLRGERG